MATITRKTNVYKDLDLNFLAHPVTGDVSKKVDEEAIKQAIRIVLLTQNYERPFHSEIGSPVRGLLFEPSSPLLNNMIKRIVTETILNFEPRVEVIDVDVVNKPDNNDLTVSVIFRMIGSSTTFVVPINIERTR
jgi:phage baseplate assembly protein W